MSQAQLFVVWAMEGKLREMQSVPKEEWQSVGQLAFRAACEANQVVVAQWLWSQGSMTVHHNSLMEACVHGHLELAQWLWSVAQGHLGEVRMAFEAAGYQNHLPVMQWLWPMMSSVEPNSFYWLFAFHCVFGHLETMQWMESVYPQLDLHRYEDHLFHLSCKRGHLSTAQYLYSLSPPSSAALLSAQQTCNKHQLTHLTEWLVTLPPSRT